MQPSSWVVRTYEQHLSGDGPGPGLLRRSERQICMPIRAIRQELRRRPRVAFRDVSRFLHIDRAKRRPRCQTCSKAATSVSDMYQSGTTAPPAGVALRDTCRFLHIDRAKRRPRCQTCSRASRQSLDDRGAPASVALLPRRHNGYWDSFNFWCSATLSGLSPLACLAAGSADHADAGSSSSSGAASRCTQRPWTGSSSSGCSGPPPSAPKLPLRRRPRLRWEAATDAFGVGFGGPLERVGRVAE